MKYLFKNNSHVSIQVPRADGRMEIFSSNQEKLLDEWFKRYIPRYLSVIKAIDDNKHTKFQNVNNAIVEINKSTLDKPKDFDVSGFKYIDPNNGEHTLVSIHVDEHPNSYQKQVIGTAVSKDGKTLYPIVIIPSKLYDSYIENLTSQYTPERNN